MKRLLQTFLFFLLLAVPGSIFGEEPAGTAVKEPETLQEIAASIDAFRGKMVNMNLRLKVYDRIFEKIVFYDTANHDIEFSIEIKKISKRLESGLINLHPGMTYRVSFKVLSVGALGLVTGELLSFSPRILQRLP